MSRPPTLPERLDAFYLEHRLCWHLEGNVETDRDGAEYVTLRCSCGASLVRRADER